MLAKDLEVVARVGMLLKLRGDQTCHELLEAAFMRRFGVLPAKYAGSEVKLESEDIW